MATQYELVEEAHGFEYIKRTTDEGLVSFIPKDEANADYRRYLRWLENPDAEEGGTL